VATEDVELGSRLTALLSRHAARQAPSACQPAGRRRAGQRGVLPQPGRCATL